MIERRESIQAKSHPFNKYWTVGLDQPILVSSTDRSSQRLYRISPGIISDWIDPLGIGVEAGSPIAMQRKEFSSKGIERRVEGWSGVEWRGKEKGRRCYDIR
jgi:hypothetical protein